jgi:hypothetical protein
MSAIHLGTVTRVDGSRLYVKVPALGGDRQFGPLSSVVLRYGEGAPILGDSEYTYYKKGDRVVVGQVGRIKEELVVLGRIG